MWSHLFRMKLSYLHGYSMAKLRSETEKSDWRVSALNGSSLCLSRLLANCVCTHLPSPYGGDWAHWMESKRCEGSKKPWKRQVRCTKWRTSLTWIPCTQALVLHKTYLVFLEALLVLFKSILFSFNISLFFLLWLWMYFCSLLQWLKDSSIYKICLYLISSHEIKRRLLLGKKVMTNQDSVLKRNDIALVRKVHIVKAMAFPVVIYGCESWTIKKAMSQTTDAFKLWCWKRLLRAPWTARRSKQSIQRKSALNIHWKDGCWSWSFNTLAIWSEEPTLWCWERLKAGGEVGNRGWDGWGVTKSMHLGSANSGR